MVCFLVWIVDALDVGSAAIRLAVLDLNLTAFDRDNIRYQRIFPAFFRCIV